MENKDYREWLIEELLRRKNAHYTRNELSGYNTPRLESLLKKMLESETNRR